MSSNIASNLQQNKVQQYIENGALLGWLIDPLKRRVFTYRPDQNVEVLVRNPSSISGDPWLRGFILNLHELW